MKANGVSDLSSSQMMRSTVLKLQREMSIVQVQASTGRIADRGLALGLDSSVSVNLNQQIQRLDTIKTLNANVSARLDTTQTNLDSIGQIVGDVMQLLVRAKAPGVDLALIKQSATDALKSMNDKLNTSYNGQFLFAGVNTDVLPVSSDPGAATATGKLAVDAAFLAEFGFAQDDPAAVNIPKATMDAFLDGTFEALFDDTNWRASFSSASDKVVRSRISMSEVIDGSVTADDPAFREITKALTMISQLNIDDLGQATASGVLDKAIGALAKGQTGVIAIQSRVGSLQSQVKDATERLEIQGNSLALNLGSLEDVDPYEMSVRYNSLSTQIETAYALTSRIKQLGLLKYI
ncbi:MAG: flagellar hook-associated family protein [Beijerinckiaceae bacterium]|jgi:flagellar hook-associated protein 3 FlgL|nr:flagellar hook-associated family protein [Beijerinckiaceae bacterium]MDO9440542.1 flagellar hook-associated family protein [Beijerinckiaceae bacterium]